MKAIGARDLNFMRGLVAQMLNACSSTHEERGELELNFMISVVHDIGPRDHLEAMLASQIAAVQVLAMRFANNIANAQNLSEQETAERIFTRLTRTFPNQIETLNRYRAGVAQRQEREAIERKKSAELSEDEATEAKVVPMKRKSVR